MKKMMVFKNNIRYFVDTMASIYPAGVEPEEEYDITELDDIEIEELKKGKKISNKLTKL